MLCIVGKVKGEKSFAKVLTRILRAQFSLEGNVYFKETNVLHSITILC